MTGLADRESEVAREIAGLADLDRASLVARWRSLYGRPPPPKLSRALMEKAIAYEVQCAAFGGLSAVTKRALRAAASGSGKPSTVTRRVSAGARLIREWNGSVHEVDVTRDGYVWQGTTYRSLTAIACRITGTKWSGPRFFGLERRVRAR
jgi:hypothetical protein